MKTEKYEEKIKNGIRLTNREASIYYNYKYPKELILYSGRAMPNHTEYFATDVRNFITPRNYLIDMVIKQIGLLKKWDNDVKAEIIQKHVCDNVQYTSDNAQTGFVEYWQYPFETIQLGQGDCEDGAILMATLLIASGVPRWRVRIAGGLVKTNNVTAPTGGHGWVCYLRESDNRWVILDWCYLPDMRPMAEKETLKRNHRYITTWFSWNDRFSWGKEAFNFADIEELVE